MANQLDQFGIKMLYPTRAGGREFFINDTADDVMNGARVGGDLADDLDPESNNTDGFRVLDNAQVRLHVYPESDLIDQGDQNLDHSVAKSRGYSVSSRDWDIRGLEMTCRILCTDHDDEDSRFILKGPSGRHRSNTNDCSGHAYNTRFFLADSGAHAGKCQFAKEQWHVHYVSRPDNPVDTGQGQIFNQWVICKMVWYIVRSPDNTQNYVKLEQWLNKNNDGITFVKIAETVDTGGWNDGDGALECNADRADEIMDWRAPCMTARWDGPTILFKDLSVREVDPFGDQSGEPEQPPTTGTISQDLEIKYNLITFPQNACGITQEDSVTEIYNVDGTSQSNLHRDRYRACTMANGSLATVIGKKPRRVILRLSKTGNPPSGEVTCVLRKGSDDTVAVTYQYTGGPSLNATSLTTSKAEYTFEDLEANYSWQNGDRLCVEYSGNTVDTTNEVNVYRNTADPFDGANTCSIKFESGGPPPTGYSAPDIARDYAMAIYE